MIAGARMRDNSDALRELLDHSELNLNETLARFNRG